MTGDDISEKACQDIVSMIDTITLRHDISLRDTARIYREVASECRERAAGLDAEADAQEDA